MFTLIAYTDWHSGFRVVERYRHRYSAIWRIHQLRIAGLTDAHIVED